MRNRMLLVLLAMGCTGSKTVKGPADETPEAADFRMICEQATRISAEPASAEQRNRFASAVDSGLRTTGAKNSWRAAGMASDKSKLAVLRQGATELKVPSWDCPAMAQIYGPQSATAD